MSWGSAEFIAAEEMGRHRGYWWAPDGERVAACRVDIAQRRPLAPHRSRRSVGTEPVELAYPAAGTTNADVALAVIGLDGETKYLGWDRETYPYLVTVQWKPGAAAHVPRAVTRPALDAGARGRPGDARHARRERGPRRRVGRDRARVRPTGSASGSSPRPTATGRGGCSSTTSPSRPPICRSASIVVGRRRRRAHRRERPRTSRPSSTCCGSRPTARSTKHHHRARRAHRGRGGRHARGAQRRRSPPLRPRPCRCRRPARTSAIRSLGRGAPRRAERPSSRRRTPQAVDRVAAAALPRARASSYPVLLDPYGGPHHQTVMKARSAFLSAQWLADQGFAVLSIDGRGTPGRGSTWERAVHLDLAGPVLEDQVDALHLVAAIASRDGSRRGRDPGLVVRRLPRRARRAATARRVPRRDRRRAGDRVAPLRHALHRALPRRPEGRNPTCTTAAACSASRRACGARCC